MSKVGVREVLKAIGETPAREAVMGRFREAGGDVNRWGRGDVRAMADAIARAEDALELSGGALMAGYRSTLKTIRRRLEALVL